jgi:hypothetical protein
MNQTFRSALLAVGFGLVCTAATARPVVAISFDLAVARWQGTFGASRAALEEKAASEIAKWLGQELGFMGYEPGKTGPHRLVVHLEVVPDAGSRQDKETQLRLELAGQPAPPMVWSFRNEEGYSQPTNGVEAFALEITRRMAAIDRRALVRQILSQIPITNEAQLWKDPVGWVMPYRKSELCLDFKSLFRIENMLPSGAGPVLKEFTARASGDFAPRDNAPGSMLLRGRLFTEPMPSQDGLSDLGSAKPELVSIKAVYVVEYQPLQPCSKPVPPDAVEFRNTTP